MGYRENQRKRQEDADRLDAYQYAAESFMRRKRQQSPDRLHATKTAICQIFYNRMDITDMDQMTPNGPYMEV